MDEDRVLLRLKEDASEVVRFTSGADGAINLEKVWSAGVFKNSYDPPVYHNGHLYGYNGRILTCVDASSGETKWRTRAVPDGFTLLVNGYLIVQTKTGSLHVGPASPDGWKETKQVELFKSISWTPPSYADNAIFSRSHAEVARIDLSSKSMAVADENMMPELSGSFAAFVKDLESSSDKKQKVDAFFAAQKQMPLIEQQRRVTFLFRGEADDVAITGDMIGMQQEEPMKRLPGTDVYYFTSELEPDARINYRFIKNFEENIADPLNPKTTPDRRGNPISWLAMPQWKEPAHLKEAPAEKRGKIESHELTGTKFEGASLKMDVYLPAGYESSKESYPVLYLLDGSHAVSQGLLNNTLDNTIGSSVRPVIVVMLKEVKMPEGPRISIVQETARRAKFYTEDLIPFVDSKYRTLRDSKNRAIAGTLGTGGDALHMAVHHPQIFGAVAAQSMWVMDVEEEVKQQLTKTKPDLRIYMDWGKYDAHSTSGGWDLRKSNREFNSYLKERGYSPAGGETHEGYGWSSWRNYTDRMLQHLFPKS
jgi:enterochelin esterase family protein